MKCQIQWVILLSLSIAACSDGGNGDPRVLPDECSDGCLVDSVCYPDGVLNPANRCEICISADSSTAFSPNDGETCDDGAFCTVADTCAGGSCAGTARSCDDGIACTETEACDEDADLCTAGTSTCAAGEVCDVATDSCAATCTGCVIDGVCYGDGQRNPANSCEVCAPASSTSSFSANDGAQCDDGLFCTVGDTCTDTVCGGAARDCGDGTACNGAETCDEDADRCEAGSSTCTDGEMCDVATDMCVLSCGGGTTACASMCVNTDYDPANCGSCGSACAAGEACVGGSCTPLAPRLAFVSSLAYAPGSFGSLAGADAQCNTLASAAGLPGTYMAWLSDDTGSPSTRFTQGSRAFVRVDGVVVANDWADLIDGTLDAAISVNESGGAPPPAPGGLPAGCGTNTNTKIDGTQESSSYNCSNWTAMTGSIAFGDPFGTTSVWSRSCTGGNWCGTPIGIYCFQQ